ncbi:5-oxoprolinase subunit PxpA [Pseudomonas sp. 10B1]|uniref:5-oxoprolinase subunit PxpA n=1 Tax=unclassified Pseudomonas TaxID=196821 RepID=UPI002AB41CA1|nr:MULTISPECIES: 5-oxoprolinase subunit PxpA [unclassified Pseudomonas]MDY7561211.1 5-oxoprolinase subunit PxpA [Pseudomonas sp. AB6]MEA9976953.1 5-oxoprolinase subunit PxpA [Pseudomonas sp. RTS4]MEA9995978.1 5-oxoprolinase subunit PxpA [Pseudomonas sp. AA4]MEB0087640.1 5-oxoprolinase subunit PxpA [Pseudomonas sp. RTI1]MEB0127779.1 5-oxoprolinase subunit PxpA [Pseudomonas sp. CCC1.2]
MGRLLLNCDIGESYGAWTMGLDAEVMPFIDCANIACGFHAGDPSVMRKTVSLALSHNVTIGAHPAYPDLVGFGRRSMACSAAELEDLLHYQIGALDGICRAQGSRVQYVKPHGAMYNDMMAKPEQLRTVIQAIARYDVQLPLMLLSTRDNSTAQAVGDEFGVTLWFETFADRAYDSSGHLVSRQLPGAVHHDPETIIAQALTLAHGQPLRASDGSDLLLTSDTLCVHGDNASSVAAVKRIRQALGEHLLS